MRVILGAVAILLMTGCAVQVPVYRAPTELTPTNSFGLRVSTNLREIRAYKFDDRKCSQGGAALVEVADPQGVFSSPLNARSIGLPRFEPPRQLEGELRLLGQPTIYVALAGGINLGNGAYVCKRYVGFSPQPGRTYELRLDGKVFSQCTVRLIEIEEGTGSPRGVNTPFVDVGKDECPAAYDHTTGGFGR